jgi:ankyrin repeat protein
MKYLRLFENFEDYDPYELMIMFPNQKTELIIKEINKDKPNLDFVRNLISLGANVDGRDEDGYLALQFAANYNSIEIARMLIDAGADVNLQDENGWTALHIAASVNNQEIVEILVDAGANLDMETLDGYTALDLALQNDNNQMAHILVDLGADRRGYIDALDDEE